MSKIYQATTGNQHIMLKVPVFGLGLGIDIDPGYQSIGITFIIVFVEIYFFYEWGY